MATLVVLVAALGGCGRDEGAAIPDRLSDRMFSGWSRVSQVSFSPDGSRVAFVGRKETGSGLAVGTVTTSAVAISSSDEWVDSVAWMPDSQTLLVSSRSFDLRDRVSRLALVDVEGGRRRQVAWDRDLLTIDEMLVMPDGRHAVVSAQRPSPYAEDRDLYSVDLRTGRSRNLTQTPDMSESHPRLLSNQTLLLSAGRLASEADGPDGWIGRLDLETGTVTRLTPEGEAAGTATISPDGEVVIYDSFPGNERQRRALWLLPLKEDAKARPLAIPGGRLPVFTPSGRQLVVILPTGMEIIELPQTEVGT